MKERSPGRRWEKRGKPDRALSREEGKRQQTAKTFESEA